MEVDTFAIPSAQTVNGEGVAQVIGSRPDPTLFGLQPGQLEQNTESASCGLNRHTAACPGSKPRNIKVDGSFDLHASVDAHVVTDWFDVKSVSVAFDYGDDLDLTFLADGVLDCKATLPILTGVRVPFAIGPIPFDAFLELDATGELKADGSLKLHGTQHLSGQTGFEWTPTDGMKPIGQLSSTAQLDDPQVNGTVTADIGLQASVGLEIPAVVRGAINAGGTSAPT